MNFRLSFLIIIACLIFSCNSSDRDSCVIPQGVATISVDGPVTAGVNQQITLNVTYKTKTDCAEFDSFFEKPDSAGNTTIITTTIAYDACRCSTNSDTTDTAVYKFKEAAAGTYTLKFKISDTNFVTHIITVS